MYLNIQAVMDLKESFEQKLSLGDKIIDNPPIPEDADSGKPNRRRSPRNFIRPIDIPLPPKVKRVTDPIKKIERIYLSKSVKRLPSTLETIYEDPKATNLGLQHMSTRKFKRVISFAENRTNKRPMKAKKNGALKRVKLRKKIAMEVLLEKLKSLSDSEGEDNAEIKVETT